ncbi:hypothetical protein G9A89_022303 [Geosiphon pyriformis]|nr:hypothetical protein G9A89_022303 [Geosiphon pyriformis]
MKDSRKMKITNNIYSLAQQLFQLIQQQEMKITINQQIIKYTNTRKRLWDKVQRKTENTVDKIMAKVKLAIETQPKITQYQEAIYWLYTGFQDQPEILFNTEIDTVTVNQMGKITNAQFGELQDKITQIIFRKKVQKLLKNGELELRDLGNLNRAQY